MKDNSSNNCCFHLIEQMVIIILYLYKQYLDLRLIRFVFWEKVKNQRANCEKGYKLFHEGYEIK